MRRLSVETASLARVSPTFRVHRATISRIAVEQAGQSLHASVIGGMLLGLPVIGCIECLAKRLAGLQNRCPQLRRNLLAHADIVLRHLAAPHHFQHVVNFP
jgi:hypothetical protein